jgi:hypothetical protein
VLAEIGAPADSAGIVVVAVDDGSVKRVGIVGSYPQFSQPGLLYFGLPEGAIQAAPFDPEELELTGAAESVTERVLTSGPAISKFAIARNGSLLYLPGSVVGRKLVILDRGGSLVTTLPAERLYRFPRFSPAAPISGAIRWTMGRCCG